MIEAVLIRRIHDAASIGTEIGAEHFEVAGREQHRRTTGGRDAIEVDPARLLPRKDDSVLGAPRERRVAFQRVEAAPGTGIGMPDLVSLSGDRIGNPDRPWLGRTGRREWAGCASWNADERDTSAVGGPDRTDVAVHARREPRDGFAAEVVHPNETVVTAAAHEGDPRPIG